MPRRLLAAIIVLLFLVACSNPESSTVRPTATPNSTPIPATRWAELVLRVPYPYTTPLPAPARSALDGTYTKTQPGEIATVHCRRCPDYAREPGIWKLNFRDGTYRVYHPLTNFASIGSFTILENHLTLFNDPTCADDVGEYAWRIENRELILIVIHDECAIELRGKNLSAVAWQSCQPPNIEAGISDHWQKPEGCE
ncbi:MAG: hypothetical protein HZC40_16320 [Chloroflexi bacterium]|nr:hypothetical protein [Chloroflexota bacterium]